MLYLTRLILLVAWLAGIVLANGFWSTFFSVIFPLWAYYLVVEHVIVRYMP